MKTFRAEVNLQEKIITRSPAAGRPLKVLLVSPVGIHGGAEQVLLQLAKYLPNFGIEPILACLRPGPLAEIAAKQGLETHVFEKNYRYRQLLTVWQAVQWLCGLVRRLDIDIIHSNFTSHLVGGIAARLTGVPEVWHHHDFPHGREPLEHLIERIPCGYALFTTDKVKSGYPRLHSKPHSVIHPFCIEPQRLQSYPAVPDIRKRLGIPDGPLFLTVARLQEHKGHHYLINSIPRVLEFCPQAVFALAGRASGSEQEAYLQQLKEQCARLGIEEQVKFLGYVGEPDLIALYREATALVHPALSEGFGISLLEAMSLSAPVIAASADGPKAIIDCGRTGILVPTADSAALSEAIVRLLQEPDLAATLRREGRRFADQCSVEEMTRKTAEIYKELVH